ncbi:MAG: TetR/AcrR family transcriptional regulator [Verrucomicrobiales bacterium]|nr:TetR/AcrR family transcriptional regulator [Verrucomicrobiales bacterium]
MARAAEFDRDQVIEKAMDVFWTKGYHATSMSDLKKAMGLQPGSIYGAFGSKNELFLDCLEHYSARAKARFDEISRSSAAQREAFGKIYDSMISQMISNEPCRGCLMINSLVELAALEHSGGKAARKYLKRNQKFFENMLKKAADSGELKSERSIEELAVFLMGTVFSLRVMGKAKVGRAALESVREQALDQVFG